MRLDDFMHAAEALLNMTQTKGGEELERKVAYVSSEDPAVIKRALRCAQ